LCQYISVAFSFLKIVDGNMPTKKPQILLTLDEDLLKRIEDYRYANRIAARSEAVRRLIDESLKRWERKAQN
jgi:metal-responsive CopG/Arc/MetJ family transcriptional regulator